MTSLGNLAAVATPCPESRRGDVESRANTPLDCGALRSEASEDDILVEQLKAGGDGAKEAFTVLYRKYISSFIRVAGRYAQGHAEDVAHDVLTLILTNINKFRSRSSFSTWAYRILVNRAKSAGVREKKMIPSGGPDAEGAGTDSFEWWLVRRGKRTGVMSNETPSALVSLMRKEARELVMAKLQRLPKKQQLIVRLVDVEDVPRATVRKTLGIGDICLRVQLCRGRREIREALKKGGFTAEDFSAEHRLVDGF